MSLATVHSLGQMQAMHMAEVVDNSDPESRGRIKVRMLATNIEIWANVVVASAGQGYGVSCIPRVEEKVVIAFITPEQALVIGSIWAGESSHPEEAEQPQDHYVVKTPQDSVLAFNDDDQPNIEIQTRSGYQIKIDESNGGNITISRGSQVVELTPSEVKMSGTKIIMDANMIEINAAQISANVALSKFSGVIQTDTCIATSVVGTSYTPGAGNIW